MSALVFTSTKGNPVTTSTIIADKFNKHHHHVLRDIRELELTERSYGSTDDQKLTFTTNVTGKGQIYFLNKYTK